MNKEQIVNELMEMDARFSGLCDTIAFINSQTLEGIREHDIRALIGTIDTLENIAKTYYSKYNALSSKIMDYLEEVKK